MRKVTRVVLLPAIYTVAVAALAACSAVTTIEDMIFGPLPTLAPFPTPAPNAAPSATPTSYLYLDWIPPIDPNAASGGVIPTAHAAGYMWWLNDRQQNIFVIGAVHQEIPFNPDEAGQWVQANQACYAQAGSTYVLDQSTPAPGRGAGIEVTSGNCAGFKGWVFVEALHVEQP